MKFGTVWAEYKLLQGSWSPRADGDAWSKKDSQCAVVTFWVPDQEELRGEAVCGLDFMNFQD